MKFTGKNGSVKVVLEANSMNKIKDKNILSNYTSQDKYIVDSNSIYDFLFTIKIIDSGQGISKEGLQKLFIDFSSLDEHH